MQMKTIKVCKGERRDAIPPLKEVLRGGGGTACCESG